MTRKAGKKDLILVGEGYFNSNGFACWLGLKENGNWAELPSPISTSKEVQRQKVKLWIERVG